MTYDPELDALLRSHPVIIDLARRIDITEHRFGHKPDVIGIDYGKVRDLPPPIRTAMIGAALERGGLRINGVPVKVQHLSGHEFQA